MLRAEGIRRIARKYGMNTGVTEKDYVIEWFLKVLYEYRTDRKIVFKGGTAIKKIYYPETWRFSHDLDFTSSLDAETIREDFEGVFAEAERKSGIRFSFRSFHVTEGSIIANIQFIGPLNAKNRLRLDITLDEPLLTEPAEMEVGSKYPDIQRYRAVVYSLEEILAEKIRSILQRGKSRDYYDVWMLLKVRKFDMERLRELVIEKCRVRGIEFDVDRIFDETKLAEAGRYWETGLRDLVSRLPDFDSVIAELREMLKEMSSS
jgi:hypothetical protein